jgi:hypothetical protein
MSYIFLLQKILQKFVQSYAKNSIFAQSKSKLGVIYGRLLIKNSETKALHIQPADPRFGGA